MEDQKLAALLLEQRRRASRTSLQIWAEMALAGVGQKPARHHRLMIDCLEDVVSGVTDRLMILAPPGSAKSTYATVLFPAYWYARFGHTAVISASHTSDLAVSFGRRVRNTVNEFQQTLGYSLSDDSRAADKWHTDRGGEYLAAGVGQAITGRRADLGVIDDPVKSREAAESAVDRESVWNWYRGSFYNRLKPNARIVLIMTRWHEDDLGGRLLSDMASGGDTWRVLSLPAVCEDAEHDPLGREVGQALWPEWEDELALARKHRVVGEREWISQYQQRPAPDSGILFQTRKIGTVAIAPGEVTKRVRAWDLASTEETGGRDPDWTVGILLALLKDGRWLVEDRRRLRGTPQTVQQLVMDTAAEDGSDIEIFLPQDPGQAGKSQITWLVSRLAGHIVRFSVMTGNKITRAGAAAAQVEAGNVLLVERSWNKTFLDELAAFPYGTHDDQVDSFVSAFNYLVPTSNAQAMLDYYTGQLKPSETPEQSRPGSPLHQRNNELVEVYRSTRRQIAAEASANTGCFRCSEPVVGTRVEDGVHVWHPGCL